MKTIRRNNRNKRGFAMIMALFVAGLLLVVGLALLTNSQYSANNTVNTEQKNQAMDSAEAGVDTAMEALDLNSGTTGSGNGSVTNGGNYSYAITNNLASSNTLALLDGRTLPGNSALIKSTGYGSLGGRPVTIETVVMPASTQINFPNDAVDAGLDIQGNWNSGNCIGFAGSAHGNNNANIHANGNITANSCFVDGTATASGNITGTVNATQGQTSGVPQVQLPTAQLATFVANEKVVAQSSPPLYPNDYIASGGSLPSSYACPAADLPAGCVVFVDGSVSMAGHSSAAFTGKVTVIVNGSYSANGNASISFQTGQKSVFIVNGNADVGGNGSAAGLIWALGDVTLHGNGAVTGAIVAGGNVDLNGGGNGGGFTYDATLQNVTLGTQGKLVIGTYGEY